MDVWLNSNKKYIIVHLYNKIFLLILHSSQIIFCIQNFLLISCRVFFFLFLFMSIVHEWDGDTLEISKISRLDMGAYLCIASNTVPPTVSKRIKVSVDCKY